jgi:PhzF family phenazine biosynthesis protein
MRELPFFQVDAFTKRPFRGNPAAVCILSDELPVDVMQDIAAENNLSETAFVRARGDGSFALRWFTPTVEVDLCGHATLAAAFVLMGEIDRSLEQVVFHTRSGALPVRRAPDGALVLDFPAQTTAPSTPKMADAIRAALGAPPLMLLRSSTGTAVAELPDADSVARAAPDLQIVAATGTSLCITAKADEDSGFDFVSRYFAPAHGIPEDPVTGSSFCVLAPFWAERLGRTALRARQLSRRGGEITCEARGDRVHIGGDACPVISGTLRW